VNHTIEASIHVHRDDVGARIGMWLFLFTELLLFGGLFIVYAVYRFKYGNEFAIAAKELDTFIGMVNTLVLLTSSLTMAMSITAIQKKNKILSMILVCATILLALTFMVNKYFEWGAKFNHGIYPGGNELLNKTNGEILYFGLYYVMTGLHGLHVIIGAIILSVMLYFIHTDHVNQNSFIKLENSGLYWHLVDIIWIFLFPLFYLIH
jgi:cytochrome c oxidase subunit 3